MLLTAKGGGIVTVGQLFSYGSRFLIAAVLARLLGAQEFGLYSLALSAGAMTAGLSRFGLDDAALRYVAVLRSRDDEEGVRGAIAFCVGLALAISLGLALILFVAAAPIADRVFHAPDLARLLRLMSLAVPFLTLSEILAASTRGFKKQEYAVIAENLGQLVVRLILIGVLALTGLDSSKAVIAFGVADVAASLMLIHFLGREVPLAKGLRGIRIDVREILTFSVPLWTAGLLSTFRNNIQTILIGALDTMVGVGVLTVVDRVNLVGLIIYRAIITSVKPVLSELHAQADWKQLKRIFQTTSRWAFMCNLPIYLAIMRFSGPILSVFGQSFLDGAPALVIITWAELFNIGTGVCGSMIDMTGHTRLKLLNSITNVIVMAGLNLYAIPRWGVIGAAIGSLGGIVIINTMRLAEVWFLFRMLPYNRSFAKPGVAGAAAVALSAVLVRWIPVPATGPQSGAGALLLVGHLLVIPVSYLGMLLLMGLNPEDQQVLTQFIRRSRSLLARNRAVIGRRISAR